jgi:calcineurin-like phosphoesterase family protein
MIWFTSDTHFGHSNIAGPTVSKWKSGYRDFESLDQMNDIIINNINKYVQEDDELYHLGDFAFRDVYKYRNRIICKNIHLILGNHDKLKAHHIPLFKSVQYYKELTINKQKIILLHYAMRVWNRHGNGSIHLYGHSHNSIDNNHGKSMDVGIDAIYNITGEYKPINVEDVLSIMDKRSVQKIDHH